MSDKDKEKETLETPKAIEEMTPEERNAEAERLENEAKNKTSEKPDLPFDENDPLDKGSYRRLEKARLLGKEEKKEETPETKEVPEDVKKEDLLSTDDYIVLDKMGYSKDSAEAKLLSSRKEQGVITDFRSGLEQVGVKAEIEALKAVETAKTVVDDIDNDDPTLITKKDVQAKYKATGEVPDDKEAQEAIVEANLEEMGFK